MFLSKLGYSAIVGKFEKGTINLLFFKKKSLQTGTDVPWSSTLLH